MGLMNRTVDQIDLAELEHNEDATRRRPVCRVDGCQNLNDARGLCSKHFQRWQRTGTTELPTYEQKMRARFVENAGTGCWDWTGYIRGDGYGQFVSLAKRPTVAHRAVYELLVGPIPAGLVLDHLCRNRRCVNPAHVEPVTIAENVRRGVHHNAVKTECPRGHPYDEANTLPHGNNPAWRRCRTCKSEDAARRYQRKKLVA